MTLSKLAQLANVSVSVVSKAFSGRADISDAMREHVFDVARQHGCFQQFYHVPYDRPVVAFIIPEAISEFYIRYVEELKNGLEECGYTLLLSIDNFDSDLRSELVKYYTSHNKVDALIFFGEACDSPQSSDTIIVRGSKNPYGDHNLVCHDNMLAIEDALFYLRSKGKKRIAFIGEALTINVQGLLTKQMKNHGFTVYDEYMICSRKRFAAAGRGGVKQLLKLPEKPDAIFSAYSEITTGVIDALVENGIKIPEEIAVISMSNVPQCHPNYDVAYIDSCIPEICEKFVEIIKERIEKKGKINPAEIHVPAKFYKGETT